MITGNVGIAGGAGLLGELVPAAQSKYYTGKNIHATSGSRTANTTDLLVGDVLAFDPHGQDTGVGSDLANPTAGFLDQPLWVVTDVPSGSKQGGWIKAVPLSMCVNGIGPVFMKANTTAGVTLLAATDMASASVNQRYLVAVTEIVDNTVLAIALAPAFNSSSTAARVNGSNVPLACAPI